MALSKLQFAYALSTILYLHTLTCVLLFLDMPCPTATRWKLHCRASWAIQPPGALASHLSKSTTTPAWLVPWFQLSTCYSSAAIRWDRLGLLEVALAPFTPSRSENGTALAPRKVASYKNAVESTIQQLTKLSTGKEHSAFQGGRTNVINLYKSS